MLKGIILSIKNKFRRAVDANTDIAGAGREHIHNVGQSILDLTNKRDEIAVDGTLIEREIKKVKAELAELREAVQKWHGVDDSKMQLAYSKFQAAEAHLKKLETRYQDINKRVAAIDANIAQLNNAKAGLKDDLADAAVLQAAGRANMQIENIHVDITNGPLSGAIQLAQEQDALAEVKRTRREGADDSDLFSYKQEQGTSLADILGEPAKRGQTEATTAVDVSPMQSKNRGTQAEQLYIDEASFGSAGQKLVDAPAHESRHETHHTVDTSSSNTTVSDTSTSPSSAD